MLQLVITVRWVLPRKISAFDAPSVEDLSCSSKLDSHATERSGTGESCGPALFLVYAGSAALWRFAAHRSGLASGLALTVRPAGLAEAADTLGCP